jgi:hypothetical protein
MSYEANQVNMVYVSTREGTVCYSLAKKNALTEEMCVECVSS